MLIFQLLRLQSNFDDNGLKNNRGISPYAEFHQLAGDSVSKSPPDAVVGVNQTRPPPPSKVYLRSTSDGKINRINCDMLHSSSGSPVDSYDYLRSPSNRGKNASQTPQPQHPAGGQDHKGTPPQTTTITNGTFSASPRQRRSASVDHLYAIRTGVKHRCNYEQLSPKDGDDADTYVYMAPLKDFQDGGKYKQGQQEPASPAKANTNVDRHGSTALDSSSELRSVEIQSVPLLSVVHRVFPAYRSRYNTFTIFSHYLNVA